MSHMHCFPDLIAVLFRSSSDYFHMLLLLQSSYYNESLLLARRGSQYYKGDSWCLFSLEAQSLLPQNQLELLEGAFGHPARVGRGLHTQSRM